jgi:hypothetical protein
LKAAHVKKKYDCAMVNEARIESAGKQGHTLIRTAELIIRPFGKGDKELAKAKKKSVPAEKAGITFSPHAMPSSPL